MICLREIPFGTPMDDPDGVLIYHVGTVEDKHAFLQAVCGYSASDVPLDARAELTVDDVEYIRLRPMSPSEARGHGLDWGVIQLGSDDMRGYAVTAVKL